MLQEFKFSTKEHNVFFVSDTHFNHPKEFLYGKRGFKSSQEHDQWCITEWNKVVKPEDEVIHLGDFILYQQGSESTKKYINMLNGHIYYIFGNHNSGIKDLYKEELIKQFGIENVEIYPLTWANKVTFVGDYIHGKIDGQMYCASHFPAHIWDKQHKGSFYISGHSHGSDAASNPSAQLHKRLDVSIENFRRPVAWNEIIEIMKNKQMIGLDHHNEDTN